MADPVASLAPFVQRTVQPTTRTTPRRSALAPLPPAHPFVSKTEQKRAMVEQVMSGIKHNRSLGAQIGGVFSGLPAGAAHLVAQGAKDAIGFVRAPIESYQHHNERGGVLGRMQNHEAPIVGENRFPTLTAAGHSFEDTAGRIAQLSPYEVSSVGGRHVVTYGDAIDNGDIVGTLIGDIGNLSIVGGAAGKVLGAAGRGAEALGYEQAAARLGKAADVAGTAGRLGGRIANAPMEAAGGVLKGAKSVWREAGQGLKSKLYEAIPTESKFGQRIVRAATPEGRLLKEAAVRARTEPSRLSNWMATNLAKDAGLVDGRGKLLKDGPSLIEQEVGLTRAVGVAQADKVVSDLIGADASLRAHVGPKNMIQPGQTMTPEGQALAHAYEQGTLPPEQMAKIDRVTEAFKRQVDKNITPQALRGEGQSPLDPAQQGDAPLNDQVQIRLNETMKPDDVAALQDLVDKGATWESLAPLAPELAGILRDPQVYPAPWRESLNVMGQGAKAADEAGIAHTLPRTPAEMLAQGFERPTYMPGNPSTVGKPGLVQSTAVTEGFGGVRKISAEQHRSTLGHGQYSLATAAEALGKNASAARYNHIIESYMKRSEIPSAEKILALPDKDGNLVDLAGLHDEAQRVVDAQNLGNMTPGQITGEVQKRFGQYMLDELHHRGYDVLPGDRLAPKPGDFDPKARVRPEDVSTDSIVLPLGLKDRLIPYRLGTDHNMLIALNTKGNAWFKRNVLPFNAHWTIGDMTSNLLMAWISGAVSPLEMFKAGRALKHIDPAALDAMFNRPEFVDTGLKYQAAKALNPLIEDRAPARTPVGKVVRRGQEAGFNLNKLANRLQRHEYVYTKLERELSARGLDSVSALGADEGKWANPKVQKAVEDVVNDANNVLGTWEEMSPMEQRVATQIFPFWSWIRHITSLVGRTAVNNPTRVLWTLRVGALGMNATPDDLPAFMRGSLGTPLGRVNLNWANPFYDVGTGGLASPSAATRSLSPLIKLGITAATGRDPSRDLNVTSHRPGTDPNQLGSALWGLAQSSPFTRGAINLAPTVDVPGLGYGLGPHRRYGSGQTILTPGTDQPADTQSRARMAANMFNLPLPQPDQVAAQATSRITLRSGLRKSGLGSGRLKRTGLSG